MRHPTGTWRVGLLTSTCRSQAAHLYVDIGSPSTRRIVAPPEHDIQKPGAKERGDTRARATFIPRPHPPPPPPLSARGLARVRCDHRSHFRTMADCVWGSASTAKPST